MKRIFYADIYPMGVDQMIYASTAHPVSALAPGCKRISFEVDIPDEVLIGEVIKMEAGDAHIMEEREMISEEEHNLEGIDLLLPNPDEELVKTVKDYKPLPFPCHSCGTIPFVYVPDHDGCAMPAIQCPNESCAFHLHAVAGITIEEAAKRWNRRAE